jgi:diacylglycerol kinase (CTP)
VKIGDKHNLQLLRKLWHFSGGILIAAVLFTYIDRYRVHIAACLSVVLGFSCWVEYVRLTDRHVNRFVIKIFSVVIRRREIRKVSGIVYYILACLIVDYFFPRDIAVLSILYLAVGDPIASLAGVLLSSKETVRIFPGKSLPGMVASFIACFACTVIYFHLQGVNVSQPITVCFLGGLSGMFAEAWPFPIDDNFSIPVVSAFLLSSVFHAFGLS